MRLGERLKSRIDERLRSVAGSSLVAFVLRISAALLSFIFSIAIARYLGAEETGLYFFAMTLVFIVASLSRLGLDDVVVKQVAVSAGHADFAAIGRLFWHSLRLVLIAATLASMALYLFAVELSDRVFSMPGLGVTLGLFSAVVLPLALVSLVAKYLQGLHKFREAVFLETTAIPLFSLLALPLLLPRWGLNGAVAAYLLAGLLAVLLAMWLFRRNQPANLSLGPGVHVDSQTAPYDVKALATSRRTLFWVMALNLAVAWSASVILAVTSTAEQMGFYQVAYRTSVMLALVLVAVNGVVAPRIAASHARGDRDGLCMTIRHANYLIIAVATPAVIFLLLFSEWVMSLFGEGFSQAGNVLLVLIVGQAVNLVAGPVGQVLTMTGHEKRLHRAFVIAFLAGLLVGVALIPTYGAVAAAAATAVSVVIVNLLAFADMVKCLKLNPRDLFIP